MALHSLPAWVRQQVLVELLKLLSVQLLGVELALLGIRPARSASLYQL